MKNQHTTTETFPVVGMSCASCAVRIGKMAQQTSGVVSASANFASQTLTIEYQEDKSVFLVKEKLSESGYNMIVDEVEKQPQVVDKIQEEEFKSLKIRTISAIVLSVFVAIFGMFFHDEPYTHLLMFLLTTPVVFVFGRMFFVRAFQQIRHLSTGMDTLVALSTGIAYAFSVFSMIFLKGGQVYFEASAMVISFVLLGRLFEERAKTSTTSALKKLIGLQPKYVTVFTSEQTEKTIPIEQIQIGDIVVVKPGDKIAVDGEVIQGSSYVDESMLSGEPISVLKDAGKSVFAGTINQKGSFRMKALKVGKQTVLSQIIETVRQAQSSQAPVQKMVDKVAQVFVPVVLAVSVSTLILWSVFGGENSVNQGIIFSVTVLVIACPCALGLATPTAIMVGVGKSAESGILVKNAESLEMAQRVNAVVFDKTGTLTQGKPRVTNAYWCDDDSTKSILVSIEKHSEHPLAEAVLHHFSDVEGVSLSNFESITGKGVQAEYQRETYFVGSLNFLKEKHISIAQSIHDQIERAYESGQTVIGFSNSKEMLCVMTISDTLKETSALAVHQLQQKGIEVYMLTGDNKQTAKFVAEKTGIKHYQAEMLPEQKAMFIRQLQQQGKVVAMVGDGINDSTALALSDVSIAMGKGSDIAMEVAKMTIISSDLRKVSKAFDTSCQTVRTIKENLFWAFIYNIISIPIAAGVFYPFGEHYKINPMIASALMVLSSISVVLNSLRLKWKQ